MNRTRALIRFGKQNPIYSKFSFKFRFEFHGKFPNQNKIFAAIHSRLRKVATDSLPNPSYVLHSTYRPDCIASRATEHPTPKLVAFMSSNHTTIISGIPYLWNVL
ncbi:hypothetical protein VNO77_21418 [Canavalia gladiata]|uniref:Uncharacterized protein n=1 Tax=Canavalia gladiata TaxID=3824 RepID=A0AAN9LV73_CANGL